MSAERCLVCGLLKATTIDQMSDSGRCWRSYEYCSKTYLYRKTIARLEAENARLVKRVSELEAELEVAWSDDNDPLKTENAALRAVVEAALPLVVIHRSKAFTVGRVSEKLARFDEARAAYNRLRGTPVEPTEGSR